MEYSYLAQETKIPDIKVYYNFFEKKDKRSIFNSI